MVQQAVEGIPVAVKHTIAQIDRDARSCCSDRVRELLYDLELEQETIITTVIESETRWKQSQQSGLYKQVLRDGIELILPEGGRTR